MTTEFLTAKKAREIADNEGYSDIIEILQAVRRKAGEGWGIHKVYGYGFTAAACFYTSSMEPLPESTFPKRCQAILATLRNLGYGVTLHRRSPQEQEVVLTITW